MTPRRVSQIAALVVCVIWLVGCSDHASPSAGGETGATSGAEAAPPASAPSSPATPREVRPTATAASVTTLTRTPAEEATPRDLTPTPAPPTATPAPVPSPDRDALIALYEATAGPQWKNSLHWATEAPVRQWSGVTTDEGGRVISLRLPVNGLTGPLPPELGRLAYLEELGLFGNELTGAIPPDLGRLGNLRELNLANNSLSGPIPPELGGLANLTALRLRNNRLSGSLPPQLGSLFKLEVLTLGGNSISGEIPPELGSLSGLKRLNFFGTQYTEDGVSLNRFTGCLSENLYRVLSKPKIAGTDLSFMGLGVCTGKNVVLTADDDPRIYGGNVFVLPYKGDLLADQPLSLGRFVDRFYEHFEDEFDFLVVLPNLYLFEQIGEGFSNPHFGHMSNEVEGIGLLVFPNRRDAGAGAKLQGVAYLHYNGAVIDRSILLHELMHRWAAYVTGAKGGHWYFSSANGMVGGFDIEDLADLGNGRYAIQDSWKGGGTFVHPDRYSPIELYLAGLVPPEEVPDLWVAEDVEWARDESGRVALTKGGYRVFEPGKVRTYSIEEIIAKHGERVPPVSRSQKDFRAAVVLLIDEGHPAIQWQLDKLSNDVAEFSAPRPAEGGKVNFYEATGGRATVSTGNLLEHWKGHE